MSRNSQFRKGSATYHCSICNKLTRETGACESFVGICLACYDEGGLENEHQDGGHDTFQADCPMCRAEKEEAEAAEPKEVEVLVRIDEAEAARKVTQRDEDYQAMVIEHAETLIKYDLPQDTVALRIDEIKYVFFLYAVDADGHERTIYTATSKNKVAGVREFLLGHVRNAIHFNQDRFRA